MEFNTAAAQAVYRIISKMDPGEAELFGVILVNDLFDWDKAATIRFRRPGRTTLYARFEIAPEELDAIRSELDGTGKIDRVFQVDLTSADGTVHASVEKMLHIARRGLELSGRPSPVVPNHRMQATEGGLGGGMTRDRRAPAAPEPGR